MRIVFMGTPDFAVNSLEALIKNGYNVVGVITAPDRPAGRGRKLQESAVKVYAKQQDIPVLQPEKLRDPEFISALKDLNADLQVVVAFRMLPEVVWNMPPMGTINVHASLLPQYRGAAPINHAIINGETKTGVTVFRLNHDIDTGDILLAQEIEIEKQDNAGSLHDKLMVLGAETLIKSIDLWKNNEITPTNQEKFIKDENLKPAPKIFKEDCEINWNKNAEEIFNFIRGMSPYPGAFTTLDDKTLKIFEAVPQKTDDKAKVGTILTDNKTYLHIACADGYLDVIELQLQGKKRMKTAEFLRGYTINYNIS